MPRTRWIVSTLLVCAFSAYGQLRIVSLNSANSSSATAGPRNGMNTILAAIGSTVSDDPTITGNSGIVRPIDVLCLQEAHATLTAPAYAAALNSIYSTTRYAAGTLAGSSTGFGTQSIVYNTQTVSLISSAAIGTASTAGQPRQTLRYQLRPFAYTSGAGDLFIYNAHFKSGTGNANEVRRLAEAEAIRADAETLSTDNVLYVGDFNVTNSLDDSYVRLQSPGIKAGLDPINMPGTWLDHSEFKSIHTQSPLDTNLGTGFNGSAGGMDDRFDFQLASASVLSGSSGILYATNSYNAFGNNGTHAMNSPINSGSGAAPDVLTALAGILDHLPIIADYQLRPKPGMALPGDATLDRTVNLSDFTALASHFGQGSAIWQDGDFNADSNVSLADFTALAANFGVTANLRANIPEPTAVLIGFGLLLVGCRRSRR